MALDFLVEDKLFSLYIDMQSYGFRDVQAPPSDDLSTRRAAIDLAPSVGFTPSKAAAARNRELREEMKCQLKATATCPALKKRGYQMDSLGQCAESTAAW